MKYCYLLLVLFLVGALHSCIDDDIANLDDLHIFTPEYSLPIGSGNFTMDDVVSSPSFDTIIADSSNWNDSLIFEYNNKYYNLPQNAVFDTTLHEYFNFSSIEEWLDNATYLMFRMNLANAIPGNIIAQIEFRDASNNVVFTLFEAPGIEIPAATNSSLVTKQQDTYLSSEEINNLRLATHIVAYLQLQIQDLTSGASYYSYQSFNLQMGIRIGLEIDSNEP